MRDGDGTLKMVERLRRADGKIAASRKYSATAVDATDWVGFLPMAWPSFAFEQEEGVQKVENADNGHTRSTDSDLCRQTQKLLRTNVAGTEEFILEVILEKKDDAGETRRIVQTWAKDSGWWTHAEYTRGSRHECSATLIDK